MFRPWLSRIMSGFDIRERRPRLLLVAVAIAVVAPGTMALELWTAGVPRLPEEAIRITTSRVVTHRNARETVAREHMYDRLSRDADGRILRDVFDERGRFLWTTEFTTEEGRLISVRAQDEDSLRWEMRFEYDDNGRVIRETHAIPGGETQRIVTYDYSIDRTEVVSYRGDGTVAWRRRETRGTIQDERETTYFYPDGSRVKTIVAEIDDQDRALREQHLDELGAVYRSVTREFEDARPVRETVRDDTGALIRETSWGYDDRGLLRTKTVELPDDGVVETLSVDYELDARQHWVRQIRTVVAELSDGTSVITDRAALEREIEYR